MTGTLVHAIVTVDVARVHYLRAGAGLSSRNPFASFSADKPKNPVTFSGFCFWGRCMKDAGTNQKMPGQCPQCGQTVPVQSLDGLCPSCLQKQRAVNETATDEDQV